MELRARPEAVPVTRRRGRSLRAWRSARPIAPAPPRPPGPAARPWGAGRAAAGAPGREAGAGGPAGWTDGRGGWRGARGRARDGEAAGGAAPGRGHSEAGRRAARTMPSLDEALQRAGEFGRFQRRVFLLLCLTGVTFAFLFVAVVFLGSRPERFWCRGPGAAALAERCGWSAEEEWNRTAPERAGRGSCQRFLLEAAGAGAHANADANASTSTAAALSCTDPLAAFPNRSAPLVPCRGGWRYVQAHSTVVSEVSVRPGAVGRGARGGEGRQVPALWPLGSPLGTYLVHPPCKGPIVSARQVPPSIMSGEKLGFGGGVGGKETRGSQVLGHFAPNPRCLSVPAMSLPSEQRCIHGNGGGEGCWRAEERRVSL